MQLAPGGVNPAPPAAAPITPEYWRAAAATPRQIAGQTPEQPDALHALGVDAIRQGDHAAAVKLISKAIDADPSSAVFYNNLAIALKELGRLDEAVAGYQKALACQPDYAVAHNNLALVLQQQAKLDEAVASYQRAVYFKPDYAAAWNNLGNAQKAQGRLDDAAASYRQALALKPDFAMAHSNLGVVLKAQGSLAAAVTCYQNALSINSDNPSTHNNLGNVLQELGRLDEAIASHRAALSLKANDPEALNNLGNAFKALDRLDEAIASYRQALAIKPDFAEAQGNLGYVLHKGGQLDAALASHRAALALKPDYAEAHNNLGLTLQDQGELDAAIASYRTALAHKPDYASAHSNLLFCLNYHPDLPAAGIFAEYQRWNEVHARPVFSPLAHPNSRDPQRRLRVGYVSPDFRRHSARHFIEPLLAHHDPAQVEVFAYAEVPSEDAVTARFKSYAAHWRRTVGLSHAEMAALIRADQIDILVDLAGHTGSNRLQVFARRPAPLQVSWLGYGYTTGMDAIDYFVADATFAPPGCEALFAEKILRLPVFAAYRPADNMGDQGPLPALNSGAITFGTLSRSVRLNHRVIRTWAALLLRLPASRLIINSGNFRDPGMQTRLRDQFAALGIASDRLLIGFDSPPWDVLRRIDITLDCFPHNSGTTLFESLYLGVPFITLADRPSVGRLGAAVLTALGRHEWIAHSEADYIDKAAALAADLPRLAAIRAGLRHDMQHSPLMNEAAFARSVEAAYREIWQQWCAEQN